MDVFVHTNDTSHKPQTTRSLLPLSGQTKLQVFQLLLSGPIKIPGYQNHAQGKQDLINPNGSDSLSVRAGLRAARLFLIKLGVVLTFQLGRGNF